MSVTKLTKSAVDAARPEDRAYELRDRLTPGLHCKIMPSGRKIFMISYRTRTGQRRKPAIGTFGELTVSQAREIAQEWLTDPRRGRDTSGERKAARRAYTMNELCDRFMSEFSERHNKPSTVMTYRHFIDKRIRPTFGTTKVEDLTRADITALMKKYSYGPTSANRTLALLRKMLNCAEIWQIRSEGTNPCRLVPMYPESGRTHLLTDNEVRRIFLTLEKVERERTMHPTLSLAVRLQFALAARHCEVCHLKWDWIDWDRACITWPDSKTGGMTKLIGTEIVDLLKPRAQSANSPYVCSAIKDATRPLGRYTFAKAWARLLKLAGVPHFGTHAIRHRAATDIANSITNVRTGMAMTGHQTVAMFMRYVHPEREQILKATELVAERRRALAR